MDELLGGYYNRLRLVILIILIIIKTAECCFEDERVALLQLKSSFRSSYFSSSKDNCCEWGGVKCSSSTGQITRLYFWSDDRVTEWKMNATLFFPFQQLTSLSLNNFFIGDSFHNQGFDRLSTLENLESFGLNFNKFKDINNIVSSIGRISSLKSLSLSNNDCLNSTTFDIQGFDIMLSRLEKLESLDLSNDYYYDIIFKRNNQLDKRNNQLDKRILSSISNISSLKSLYLSYTGLNSTHDIQGLSKLVNLEALDLSYNNFNKNSLVLLSLVSSLSSLKTLNLSYCGLKGTIQLQELDVLGNLEVLKLSGNQINKLVASRDIGDRVRRNLSALFLDRITPENGSSSNVEIHSLGAAYPDLKTISLCENHFEGPIFVQDEGNNLRNLEELFLNGTSLDEKAIDSLKLEGMSSLKRLSFAPRFYFIEHDEDIEARPKKKLGSLRFFNLKNLEYLAISDNTLNNNILKDIGKLISLKTLILFHCRLSGSLPTTEGLCNLSNLEELDLSSNELSGTLPQCIANLTSLQWLDFSNNQFEVPLSLEPFFNLSNLKYLYGGDNYILYEDHAEVHDSTPKFQLEGLRLSGRGNGIGNAMGFPKFLWHQHDLQFVDLSNIELKGEFPYWLLQNNTKLGSLNLANNFLSGPLHLPAHSQYKYLENLDISNNDLNGTIPTEIAQILPNLYSLNLSGNGLVGGMPSSFVKMRSLAYLDLSDNELSGEIPGDLKIGTKLILSNNHFEGQIFPNKPNCKYLNELRVDNNNFSGAIPYNLLNCTILSVLDASNNNLFGKIPGWLTNMSFLAVLDLSENRFFGSLPVQFGPSLIREVYLSENTLQGSLGTSFYNCSSLVSLDLSRNKFSGTIPKWIGELPELSYLLMSHNNLEGEMPVELCNLEQLSLLDLSYNNLSGHVLSCIRPGSKYMKEELNPYLASAPAYMEQPLPFTTKSTTFLFERSSLRFISGMDLSCNNFTGKIPAQIGNLTMIQALNLSHNNLIGPIPESFSNLTQIESLDLSYNNLYGKIPSDQLLQLHWLSDFSVAYNNLSGSTPGRVDQFATFENTSYEGNPFLCGLPLTKSCSPIVSPSPNAEEEEEYDDDEGGFMDMEAFYMSCVISYIVVLCTITAVLYVNPYWRRRWFYMITNCYYFIEDNLLFPLFKFRAL